MRTTPYERGGSRRGACAMLVAVASVLGLVGCSGSHDARPSRPTASAGGPAAPSASRSLDQEAKPAVALVDQYAPSGYPASAVASGYDWGTHAGQEISENLAGPHLFQIACSGSGTVLVKPAAGSPQRKVVCGQRSAGLYFSGRFDAVVDGAATNTGTYAWRILAKA